MSIHAGDTLEIRVSGERAIDGSYKVLATGEVVLPYLDILYVEGITTADLEEMMRKTLSAGGVEPEVSVRIPGRSPEEVPPATEHGGEPPVPSAPRPSNEPFTIHPGDKLNIIVANEKSLSGEFTVNAAGDIPYPLLGDLSVAGMSLDEVQQRLRRDIDAKYIIDPKVAVTFVQTELNSVDISGKINKPGNYMLTPNLTLLRLITQAGGLSSAPSITKVQIVRQENGRKQSQDFDFTELVRGSAPDPGLKRGDILFVEEIEPRAAEIKREEASKDVMSVFGQVMRPGNYRVASGTTLVRLIGEAGGFTQGASTGRVRIVRMAPEGKKIRQIDAGAAVAGVAEDPVMQDGDVVIVPESFF